MYHLLPELAGDTRTYLGDDSPANDIAGILYSNPTGTKFTSVTEPYRSRGTNRALGNLAANSDRNRHVLQTELAVSERVALTPAATDMVLSGRFYVQDFPNGATDLPFLAALVDSQGAPLSETVTDIEFNDAASGWVSTPANSGTIVIVDTNAVTAMTAGSVTATSSLADVRAGDHCELTGGVNAGTYLVDRVSGNEVYLRNLDGEPIEVNTKAGFDTTDMPTSCRIVSNGHFLLNPRVSFSSAIPAGTNYLLICRSQYLSSGPLTLPSVASTFPEYAASTSSDTLQSAYNAGNTIDLAATANLTVTTPAASAADFEVLGGGAVGYFRVSGDATGAVSLIETAALELDLLGTTAHYTSGSGGLDVTANSGGALDVRTESSLGDSGAITVTTGAISTGGADSGQISITTGAFGALSGTHNSGAITVETGSGGQGGGVSGGLALGTGDAPYADSGDISIATGDAGALNNGTSGNIVLETGTGLDQPSGSIAIGSGTVSGSGPTSSGNVILQTGSAVGAGIAHQSGRFEISTGNGSGGTGAIDFITGHVSGASPGGSSGRIRFATGFGRGAGERSGDFVIDIGTSTGGTAGDIVFNLGEGGTGADNGRFIVNDPSGVEMLSLGTTSPNTLRLTGSLEVERSSQNEHRLVLPYTDDVRGTTGALRYTGAVLQIHNGASWVDISTSTSGAGLQDAYEDGNSITADVTYGSVDFLLDNVYWQARSSTGQRFRVSDDGLGNVSAQYIGGDFTVQSSGTFLAYGNLNALGATSLITLTAPNIQTSGKLDLRQVAGNKLILPERSAVLDSTDYGGIAYEGGQLYLSDGKDWIPFDPGGGSGDMQDVYDNGPVVDMTDADDVIYRLPAEPGAAAFHVRGDQEGRFLVQGNTLGGIDRIEAAADWFDLEAYESDGFRMTTSARTTGPEPSGEFSLSTGQITGTATGSSGMMTFATGNVIESASSGGYFVTTGDADIGNSGHITFTTGSTGSGTPGDFRVKTGNVGAGGTTGGDIVLETGAAIDGPSADFVVTIGNSSNDDSGDIEFNLGTPGFGQYVGEFVLNDPSSIPILRATLDSGDHRVITLRSSLEFDRTVDTVPNDYRLILPYTLDGRGSFGALRCAATGPEWFDGSLWQPLGGGSGTATLQSAYDNGNTISTSFGRDISFEIGEGAEFEVSSTLYPSEVFQVGRTPSSRLYLNTEVNDVTIQANDTVYDALTQRTADQTGATNTGGIYLNTGDVVDGTAGSITLHPGRATGTGTLGSVTVVQQTISGLLTILDASLAGIDVQYVPMTITSSADLIFERVTGVDGSDGTFVLPESSAGQEGALRYNGTDVQYHDGSSWNNLGGSGTPDSLQDCYDTGNTILTTASRDVSITTIEGTFFEVLSDSSGDYFRVGRATGEDLSIGAALETISLVTNDPTADALTLFTLSGSGAANSGGVLIGTGDTFDGSAGDVLIRPGIGATAFSSGNCGDVRLVARAAEGSGTDGAVSLESANLVRIVDGSSSSTDTGYLRGSWKIQRYPYAFETINAGDCVCLVWDGIDARLEVRVASPLVNYGEFLGVALYSAAAGTEVFVITDGMDVPIRTTESWTTTDLGLPCFLDPSNPGQLTRTAPSTSGQWITRVGLMTGANTITIKSFEPKGIL